VQKFSEVISRPINLIHSACLRGGYINRNDFGENAMKKERISPKILIFAPQCQSSDTENYLFI
jgi:hypothetical protein